MGILGEKPRDLERELRGPFRTWLGRVRRRLFESCRLCPSLNYSYGDPSSDDLIITGPFGEERRIAPFIRSLRSVGSQAYVVLIAHQTVPPSIIEE
jgi:hypothetical protein